MQRIDGFIRSIIATLFLAAFFSVAAPDPLSAAEGSSSYDVIEQMIDEGNYDRAEDLLTDRLVTNDKDVVALSMLGELYRIKGSRKNAVETLQKAIKLDANYPESYFALTKTYLGMQKYDEADAQFAVFKEKMKPFVGKDPTFTAYYVNALHYMNGEYMGLKRYDDFRAGVDEIFRIKPDDQQALYNLGIYYYNYKHDRPSAYQAFDKAVKLDPSSTAGKKARYAIEFIRANPDSRVAPDLSFINQEFKE